MLVLATLWPEFWNRLTARPLADEEDLHAQARELLTGRDITVPAAFTAAQVRQLAGSTDPRLALAAGAAEGGQVTQFLAGAPELMARYRNAPPAAAALINAAIDARRLGMGVALPLAFLEAAAPGLPERRRLGRAQRGLAGTGPRLHRRPGQGHPRPAVPHPPPHHRQRHPGSRPGLPAGGLPRAARPPRPPASHSPGRLLEGGSPLRRSARPAGP